MHRLTAEDDDLCMFEVLALVLENNALPCPVCTTNPAWGLETSHSNLPDGAKPHLRS